jgi:hypothetical protein
MTPESDTLASPINTPTTVDNLPALPIDDAPDEWHAWREDKLYDIESIVSAEPSGRGWKLRVKWEGHRKAPGHSSRHVRQAGCGPTSRSSVTGIRPANSPNTRPNRGPQVTADTSREPPTGARRGAGGTQEAGDGGFVIEFGGVCYNRVHQDTYSMYRACIVHVS